MQRILAEANRGQSRMDSLFKKFYNTSSDMFDSFTSSSTLPFMSCILKTFSLFLDSVDG